MKWSYHDLVFVTQRRIEDNRNAFVPCYKHKGDTLEGASASSSSCKRRPLLKTAFVFLSDALCRWPVKIAVLTISASATCSFHHWACAIPQSRSLEIELLLKHVPFSMAGCRPGNGEKLNRRQAEPDQAITSAVAYFPSVSCATSCALGRYI